MKIIKIIGLLCLICFTFFYTEKVIDVTIEQDNIMLDLKNIKDKYFINPTNAIVNNDTIVPGTNGQEIDIGLSYKKMKKIGTYNSSLLEYKEIYPNVSIYNNYDKYIVSGNQSSNKVSLIYILNNSQTINNITKVLNSKNTIINFFIDSNFLNNNIQIINKLNNNEIYNYGKNGEYTKDNLIIINNIINNKAKNKSTYCLFLEKNEQSKNNCSNNKMFSIIPSLSGNYQKIKNNLSSGNIILINNTQELSSVIDYIFSKGYEIVPLSKLITEKR